MQGRGTTVAAAASGRPARACWLRRACLPRFPMLLRPHSPGVSPSTPWHSMGFCTHCMRRPSACILPPLPCASDPPSALALACTRVLCCSGAVGQEFPLT